MSDVSTTKVMLPVTVRNLYFGAIDADNEVAEDEAKFLGNFYDPNNIAHEIKNNPIKYLILGKKGTGKTAVGKFIEVSSKKTGDATAKYISFDAFDYRQFARLKDNEADSYEQYMFAWKWILLTYAGLVVTSTPDVQDLGIVQTISRLIQTVHGDSTVGLQRLLNRRVAKGFEVDLAFVGDFINDPEGGRYSFRDVTEALESLLMDVPYPQDSKFILVIDGLDEKIRPENIYSEAVSGLLWVTSRLNREFRNAGVPIKIVIMLRDDVYGLLFGPNINKPYYDNSLRLDWVSSSKTKSDWPISKLIGRRINNSLRAFGNPGLTNPLESLLPERVHTRNASRPAWDWVLDLTTCKPRDIIMFFKCCQELCIHGERQISEGILWDALKPFSQYMDSEFRAELYGHLNEDEIRELFESIFPRLRKRFNLSDFAEAAQYAVLGQRDPADVLTTLYSLGIVSIIDKNDFRFYVWRSGTAGKTDMANYEFEVHLGLWKRLSFW